MTSTAPSAAAVNHWAVLGLTPGADAASLKRTFRQLARRWHPDLNGNDPHAEEQFKAVNEAYAVLSDPVRRRQWEAGLDGAVAAEAGLDPFASGFPEFDDYVEALFGRQRRSRQAAPRRVDQEREAQPRRDGRPLNDAADEDALDDNARGDNSADTFQRQQPGGRVTASPPAPPPVTASSDSETLVELTPEQALEGERVELELQDGTTVEVWTPPLAGDGWRLRLAGVAPGGADHFLQLRVRTPDGLRIDGLRVLYQLELHPADAALGCQVVVPTLEGPVRLRVPPGSSSGRLLRLRQRGQSQGEQRGDQLVEVRIVVPATPTEAEEALFRRLRELDREQNGATTDA